jgi:hypothetical protein
MGKHKNRTKNRQIVDGEGDPCPRCGQPTGVVAFL